jgi:hypothetical protein
MPFYSAFGTKRFLAGWAVNWLHILFNFSHVNSCIASRPRTEPAVLRVEDYFYVSFYFVILCNFLFGQIWLEFFLRQHTLTGVLGTLYFQATIVFESVDYGHAVGFEALFTERVATLGEPYLHRPQPCSLFPRLHVVITYGTVLELLRHQLTWLYLDLDNFQGIIEHLDLFPRPCPLFHLLHLALRHAYLIYLRPPLLCLIRHPLVCDSLLATDATF